MEYLDIADRLRSLIVRAQEHNMCRDDVLIELSFMMDEYELAFEMLERDNMRQQGVYA
jgi:hypothetical protein